MIERKFAISPAFIERMQALMGDEVNALLDALQSPPASGLRVNSLKISSEAFANLAPFSLEPLAIPGGFRVTEAASPGKHAYHASGLYYLQDPAAMAAAWRTATRSARAA